jgi:hypothetical protein
MIDTATEHLLTLSQAARSLPNRRGKRGVNVSTVWRWMQRGIRGVRLDSSLIGGIRYTSQEALERFFSAVTAAANGEQVAPLTSRQRERRIQAAERELANI